MKFERVTTVSDDSSETCCAVTFDEVYVTKYIK